MKSTNKKSKPRKPRAKFVPFTVMVPGLRPREDVAEKQIEVEVTGKLELLTPRSMEKIERAQMQFMINRLNSAVQDLYTELEKLQKQTEAPR